MALRADLRKARPARVYESILDLLPSVINPTPVVRLNRVTPYEYTEVFAKLEWFNPFGSVKDRVAFNMVRTGQLDGTVDEDQRFVEPTSGNTGLGLAMVANANGYRLTTPLSKAIPEEKRSLLRFFGAEVEELEDDLCPAPGAPEGAIARARQIASLPGYRMLDQYSNEANPEVHYRTTGPEIWHQTDGEVTHFVAALGTCGTMTGVGRFLREQDNTVNLVGVHPSEGHDIPGVRSIRQLAQTRFFDREFFDELVEVENAAAYELCARLHREESLPAGPSSALALAGAFRVIPDEPGIKIVVIFPDSSMKYGSSMKRHVPGVAAQSDPTAMTRREVFLDSLVENVRANSDWTVDVDRAKELVDRGGFVLDVRSEGPFAESHVPGAWNTPLLDLPDRVWELPGDKDRQVLTICQRGNLSLSAVLYLKSLGYQNAWSVTGGTDAWREAGYRTVTD